MKLSRVPYANQFDTRLPSFPAREMKDKRASQSASRYRSDEVYLRPIAVIENSFTKQALKFPGHEKGTIVDLYA
ncbi:MAG: hypothetical protein JRH18_17020 [Deltaproteobacteria bacterium]|nr:hypothetical protein [Deltaproteobacteria bacterium]MBW1961037.1 hypothetical protein [Deltaproteobacteria bacterium]MBW1996099.1 hypothetical protein [Deltaproteobacteria bacterium]MBW2153360.1 hypothetical protein [Deltaproteobacteria bacterium]